MPHFGGFCPEMRLWAELGPKTINIPCAMEGFPPRAGNVRFSRKVALFAHFHTFRENHFFHDFHDFHGNMIFEFSKISRVEKVRKVHFHDFMEFS